MAHHRRNATLSRRAALARVAAGVAGSFGFMRRAAAADSAPASRPSCVERLSGGIEVWQVTTEARRQSNIYCETPYCSRDSRYFVYERRDRDLSRPNKCEFVAVELGTWKQHTLGVAPDYIGVAVTPDGVLYHTRRHDDRSLDLVRVDLGTGVSEKVFSFGPEPRLGSLGTVSPDHRYYACGKRLDERYTRFGILLVDLKEGRQQVIDEDPYIFNPHPQFEPGEGRQLMIQHNRGGGYSPDGTRIRTVGPEGATLYLLSVPDGKRTPLRVGKPYTTMITGHEAWIGTTREMLLSVVAEGEYAPDKGNLLAVRAGGTARTVARGYAFNHVGVSRCGRLFSCDDWRGTCKLVIGSIATGRTAVVCESHASRSREQNTHPHAYLTPDLKWLIFNSDRSGFPHIYAARVPEEMVAGLTRA